MGIDKVKMIELPKIQDPRGNLSVIETGKHIPFDFKRIFYLYDVPGGTMRAGHANVKLEQVLIAMSGSFDAVVDDGFEKIKIHLNRSYQGLYIPGMIWRELENFSSASVCLVLASDFYDETDYYRDYAEFVQAARKAVPHKGES